VWIPAAGRKKAEAGKPAHLCTPTFSHAVGVHRRPIRYVTEYLASPPRGVFCDADEAEWIRTVHTALDRGINFIDVSPYYGLTRAAFYSIHGQDKE
jgi:hypothetical protein